MTRPIWLVVLTVVTVPFVFVFGRFERPETDHRSAPALWQPVVAVAMACAGLGLLAVNGVADADGLNGLALALPFAAVVVGGAGGPRIGMSV
jgi:hypothetical protein